MDSVSEVVSAASPLSDEEAVRRVRDGETALFEILMRRHNQRLYRVARSVLRDDDEAEDVVQQSYVNAFTHLGQFEERAKFSTWMTRIALNEAFARRRRVEHLVQTTRPRWGGDEPEGAPMDELEAARSPAADPERQAYAGELRQLLESAVDALPEPYRVVFVLRDVEGLSTDETGASVGLSEDAVKTRLHRARAMIRSSLAARLGAAASTAFAFPATRCDRVVAAVFARLQAAGVPLGRVPDRLR